MTSRFCDIQEQEHGYLKSAAGDFEKDEQTNQRESTLNVCRYFWAIVFAGLLAFYCKKKSPSKSC